MQGITYEVPNNVLALKWLGIRGNLLREVNYSNTILHFNHKKEMNSTVYLILGRRSLTMRPLAEGELVSEQTLSGA